MVKKRKRGVYRPGPTEPVASTNKETNFYMREVRINRNAIKIKCWQDLVNRVVTYAGKPFPITDNITAKIYFDAYNEQGIIFWDK